MAKQVKQPPITATRFFASVGLLGLISVSLLVLRVMASDSSRYLFLLWNLVLAAIPLLLSLWLVKTVQRLGWLSWQSVLLTLLLLGFLPNSFYLITDFVHLEDTLEVNIIYDVMMLASFMFSGVVLGYSAVFIVHRELRRRLSENKALGAIALVFLATSFAIYLGRFSRWNTWDLLLSPAGLLFDVSDRFINPEVHSDTFLTTAVLFLVLTSLYLVVYEASKLVSRR